MSVWLWVLYLEAHLFFSTEYQSGKNESGKSKAAVE